MHSEIIHVNHILERTRLTIASDRHPRTPSIRATHADFHTSRYPIYAPLRTFSIAGSPVRLTNIGVELPEKIVKEEI